MAYNNSKLVKSCAKNPKAAIKGPINPLLSEI